jgi:uncharacterized protein (TIGR03435 family)
MKRAPIFACVGLMLASAPGMSVAAQGKSSAQRVRAEQGIPAGEVHILPSRMQPGSTSIEAAGDRWNARGYDLKSLISEIYEVDARRVELGNSADADARWDVTLQLPREVDEDVMERMLKSALERKFALKITPETRKMDVYVLTAPNGPGAALHPHGGRAAAMAALMAGGAGADSDGAGQITYIGRNCSGVVSSNGIEASAAAIGEFRRTLEQDLDRLLVDETHLAGSYDFKLGAYANQQELFSLMQQKLGIVVVPGQRQVEVLTVTPAHEMQATL